MTSNGWPIIGVLSSYREGSLARDAVRSLLRCCDEVLVLEAGIGLAPEVGHPTVLYDGKIRPERLLIRQPDTTYPSDAEKRTAMLRWAQERADKRGGSPESPFWLIVLDGDEVLLWPELLPAYLDRAGEESMGAMKIKLVQAGDEASEVQDAPNRLLPGHLIDSYALSSFHIRLKGSSLVTVLPLGPAKRPPLQGEPHILHRAYLRPLTRNDGAIRLSEAERLDLVDLGFDHLRRPFEVAGGRG